MRLLLKILLGVCIAFLASSAIGAGWFFLYSGDLPGLKEVKKFSPSSSTVVTFGCESTPIHAVSYVELGTILPTAIIAAEGRTPDRANRVFESQVARRLCCDPSKMLYRHIQEWRAANQLRLKFTKQQILTMYANTAYFANGAIGVEAASEHFYGKHVSELDLAQAAMIAGMMRSPNMYSPERHPEKATQRRDQVLDVMVAQGAISAAQADVAKSVSAKCEAVSR